jgi:hypothetical protein
MREDIDYCPVCGWFYKAGEFWSITGLGPFSPEDVVIWTEVPHREEVRRWVESR